MQTAEHNFHAVLFLQCAIQSSFCFKSVDETLMTIEGVMGEAIAITIFPNGLSPFHAPCQLKV